MGIRSWFGRNLPLPPTGDEIIARGICDKLIPLDKKIREEAYYKICEDPHFDKGVKKALVNKHREHIIHEVDHDCLNQIMEGSYECKICYPEGE